MEILMKKKLAIKIRSNYGTFCEKFRLGIYSTCSANLNSIGKRPGLQFGFGRGCVFPGNADSIFSHKSTRPRALLVVYRTQEGGFDLGRKIPPRAQRHRVVLSATMDARQYHN